MKKFLAGLIYPATFMEFINIHYSRIQELDKKSLGLIEMETYHLFQNVFSEYGISNEDYIKKLFRRHIQILNMQGSLSITVDSPLSVLADGGIRTKAAIDAYTKFTNIVSR